MGVVLATLSQEQELLVLTARDLLERRAPLDSLSEREGRPDGHDRGLWEEMAGLGWAGLLVAESHSGVDGDHASLALLAEEMGRVLLPSPFVATAGAARALEALATGPASERLAELATGESIPVLAIGEGTWSGDPETIYSNGRVSGQKRFVEAACAADFLLVTARTESGDVRLVEVDVRHDGVHVHPTSAMAGGMWGEIQFHDAPGRDLGDAFAAVESGVTTAAVAESAWCAGALDRLLWETVKYVKERRQFGVPIGSFQAIQHSLADCSIAAAESISLARCAASAVDNEDIAGRRLASTAFLHASRSFVMGARRCHQAWGGIGFSLDAPVHHFSRRAKVAQHSWGGPTYHLEIIVEALRTKPLLRDRYLQPLSRTTS